MRARARVCMYVRVHVCVCSRIHCSQLCSAHALHGAVNSAASTAADDARDPVIATVGSDGMLRTWAAATLACTGSAQVASRDALHVKYCGAHDAWFTTAYDMCVRM